MWRPKFSIALLGIAAILLSATARTEEPVGSVDVSGPEKRLREFHQNLLESLSVLVGTNDESNFFVVCAILGRGDGPNSECSKLSNTKDEPAKIVYTYRRDHSRLEAFVLSWNEVQNKDLDANVKLSFGMNIAPRVCATAAKPQCVFNPVCAGPPRQCEKTAGPPCEPC